MVTDQVTREIEVEWNGNVVMPTKITVHFAGRTFEFNPLGQLGFPVVEFPIKWLFGSTKEIGGPDLVEGFSMLEIYKTDMLIPPHCTDGDGDGYYAGGEDCGEADCNDSDPTIHPNAREWRMDGIDSNCNGIDSCGTIPLDGQQTKGSIMASLTLYLIPVGLIYALRRRMKRTVSTS